ncbi:MAG: class III signal peptide-containing protein [Candidatus Micrarchaeia archaeon]|jgi:uncharacterized protein (UPF0333 family)
MKGQLSAEMLVLIAVILAIVAIVSYQLISTAQKGSEKIESQADSIFDSAKELSKAKEGQYCVSDEQCLSGMCFDNKCR